MPSLLRKHRTAAIVGAAIIVGAGALPFAFSTSASVASAAEPAGIIAPGGSFAPIVDADKPAVVTVTTTMKATDTSADSNSPMDEQFRQFFENQGIPFPKQMPRQQQSQRAMALGSGFIISPDGIIVTNNHVIQNAIDIKVTLDDGTELPAKLLGADAKSDLAVLKIKAPKPLATIAWGDSDKLKLGDQILAIGNPFGIGTTVTAGIVSARGRDLHSGPYDDFIQIDAPINHGNSGGPLVDTEGKVVGINTAIYSPNGGSVGVGFAIPSDQAQKIVARLMKDGSIDHGYLGVQIQPVTGDVADAIGLEHAEGALVAHVSDGSPAAEAGIRTGDVVTAFGGSAIKTPKDLSRMVADVSPGAKEELSVWRDGKNVTIPVTVGGNDTGQKLASAGDSQEKSGESSLRVPAIGLGLGDITPSVRQAMNLQNDEHGAVVESVNPDKPAATSGIQPGDIILSVTEAGKSGKKSVLLLIERGDTQTFVAVPFGNA